MRAEAAAGLAEAAGAKLTIETTIAARIPPVKSVMARISPR